MDYVFLLLPVLAAVGWALHRKITDHKYLEALFISVPALAVLCNAGLVYGMMQSGVRPDLQWPSMLLRCTVVPMAYMYFSHQIGRPIANGVTIALWSILAFLLLPHAVLFLPAFSEPSQQIDTSILVPFSLQIVKDGRVVFFMLTGDCIIIVQALLTMLRIHPVWKTIHKHSLRLNANFYYFVVWWLLAIAFILSVSVVHIDTLSTPVWALYFFTGTAFLLTTIYVLVALGFDLHPIVTATGEVVDNLHEYAEQEEVMAALVRRMVEQDRVYLSPGYSAKDVVNILGTNQTYFRLMMHRQFGMSYSDYVQQMRIRHAQELLLTTHLKQDEIALQTGFAHASHMGRAFKEATGMTPGAWKKAQTSSVED